MNAVGDILVVEDNPITRRMLRISLECEGHRVREAEDGAGALALFAESRPDLVLQDFVLPDMDGLQLIRSMRSLRGGTDVPILVVTGLASRLDDLRTRTEGPVDFLAKPVEPSRLVSMVDAYLRGALAPAPAPRRGNVVVAADDSALLGLCRFRLSRTGLRVRTASSEENVLAAARADGAGVVLADLVMGVSDGLELCRRVRSDRGLASTHVVLVTECAAEDEDRGLAARVGACAVVSRSPDFGEELAAIDACLSGKHAPGGVAADAGPPGEGHLRVLEHLRRQAATNEASARRIALQAASLSVLRGIAEALARPSELPTLLGDILVHCLDATGLSSGLLYAFDAGGRFRLEAHSGLSQDAAAEAASGFGSMEDLAALANATASVACTGAAGDPPGLVRILRRLGQASLLAIPFPAGIEHRGLLLLLDATGQDLAEAHWSTFATALAAQFGQAVALGRGLARLAASEERYRRIVELTREGVVVTDVDGRIAFANTRIAGLLGTTPPAMTGGALADRAHPEDRTAVEALVAGGRSGPVEADFRLVGKDRRSLRVRVTASPLHDDAGALVGVLTMLADVTERQRLEDELRQSQKLEAVGALAGGIAHDFNNMLTVILGYAEILEAAPTLDPVHRAQIVQIRSASQQAARLTQQLLAFSRKQVLRLEVVDINAVVRDTETLLRRAVREDIELRMELAPDAWPVRADSGQVVQVLLNLAVNARDAMPDGGTLTIGTSNRTVVAGATDAPPSTAPGEYLLLEAADAGTGMDEATRRRIFEPFFTTKPAGKGTGLGLATVYGIVRQCGGYVDVDTAPGKGARFRIFLPRTRDAAPASPAGTRSATPRRPGTGQTVVVLEDDEQVRAFACVALRSAGYEAVPVADAAEAVRACAAAPGGVVLLADLVMPGRSGPEVAAEVCAANPRVRVVFMSGHAEPTRLPRLADGSPAEVLAKPFSGRELLEAVRRVAAAS